MTRRVIEVTDGDVHLVVFRLDDGTSLIEVWADSDPANYGHRVTLGPADTRAVAEALGDAP